MKFANNSKGMSLIELVVAMGILTLVSLSSAYMIQSFVQQTVTAERRSDLAQNNMVLRNALKFQRLDAAVPCEDMIDFPNGFNPNDQSEVTISRFGQVFRNGWEGQTRIRIDRLYFADAELLGNTDDSTTYTATSYIEASVSTNGRWEQQPRKSLGSMSIVLDGDGNFVSCNLNASAISDQAVCNSVTGMRWTEARGCEQMVATQIENNFLSECPGGFVQLGDGSCVPEKTDCSYFQRMPRQVAHGTVQPSCVKLAPEYVIAHDANYTTVKSEEEIVVNEEEAYRCTCGDYDIAIGEQCTSCRKVGNKIGGGIDTKGDTQINIYVCNGPQSTDGDAGSSSPGGETSTSGGYPWGNNQGQAYNEMPQVAYYYHEESKYCEWNNFEGRKKKPGRCPNNQNCTWNN